MIRLIGMAILEFIFITVVCHQLEPAPDPIPKEHAYVKQVDLYFKLPEATTPAIELENRFVMSQAYWAIGTGGRGMDSIIHIKMLGGRALGYCNNAVGYLDSSAPYPGQINRARRTDNSYSDWGHLDMLILSVEKSGGFQINGHDIYTKDEYAKMKRLAALRLGGPRHLVLTNDMYVELTDLIRKAVDAWNEPHAVEE